MQKLIILFLLVANVLSAQQRQMTLKDAILGMKGELRRDKLSDLSWKNKSVFTWYSNDTLFAATVKQPGKEVLLTLHQINSVANKAGIKSVRTFSGYKWEEDGLIQLKSQNNYYLFNTRSNSFELVIEAPRKAENVQFSSKGKFVVYTIEDDLYVTFADGSSKQITNDGGNGIVNGKTVHRVEFGITKGIFISPGADYIAFYRKDESMVYDYPLVDYMTGQAEFTPVKYPMSGEKSHQVTLGVYNIQTGEKRVLDTAVPSEDYLTNVAWSPGGEYIYIAELNRGQDHMLMNKYDVSSGKKVKTLFEEKHRKYVEPLHPVLFSEINNNEFYFLTRRDGWFHIYKYNTNGDLLKQVTEGEWEVTKILGFDDKEKFVFVEATKESPLETHIYRVEIKSGETIKLTEVPGAHSGFLSPGGDYVIDDWEAPNIAGQVNLLTAKGKKIRTVHVTKDPLRDFVLGDNSLVDIQSADGKYTLSGRLIKPLNFSPDKKYPVVVYVYGGPHSQLVTKGWHNNIRWWQYYMASQGFICFTMDNRGTNNRGRDFETAVHRQLGVLETEDQMQGIEYLKSLPYVDAQRIGVHGWSYGGFMTLNLMLRHPETFSVGVAGGPVVDWKLYEVMYGERYMDLPSENPEGYSKTNMAKRITDLEGDLLVIHGAQDETVVMQHSMQLLREAVKNNVQVDFFAYPTHPHNVRGKDRLHLMEMVSNYFIENL